MSEREEFESWARGKMAIDRSSLRPEEYLMRETTIAWMAWQARAASLAAGES